LGTSVCIIKKCINLVKEEDFQNTGKHFLYIQKRSFNIIQLSREDQQRVAIARELSCYVVLFITGEPTANKIIELFQELEHQEGKCVIVVTHSQEFAKKSDRAVYLSKKKLVVNEIKNR